MMCSAEMRLIGVVLALAWGLSGAHWASAADQPQTVPVMVEPDRHDCPGAAECKSAPAPEPVTGKSQPAGQQPFRLTSRGIGRLTGETVFTLEAIGKALPGFQIRKAERQIEGMTETVFHGLVNGQPALIIGGERVVDSINVVGRALTGPGGVRIDDTLSQVRKKIPLDECYRGVEDEADKVICAGKGANIGYWFAYPMPRRREPDVLQPQKLPKTAVLLSMFWYRMD